jgi:hypothetical protein
MARYFYAVIAVVFLLSSTPVFSQKQTKAEKQKIQQAMLHRVVIDSQYFEFIPQYAFSMGGKSRYVTDFFIKISKTKIESYLPYFGVAYHADLGATQSPLEFTSTDFTYSIADRKKGGWYITIEVKDSYESKKLVLEIFESGTASLQITSSNRQPMHFDGYVQEVKEKKETGS